MTASFTAVIRLFPRRGRTQSRVQVLRAVRPFHAPHRAPPVLRHRDQQQPAGGGASIGGAIPASTCDDSLTMDGDGPRFGAMIGLVAVVVATVILVFFGIGYALGRLFL
jgi:hypothetical protein